MICPVCHGHGLVARERDVGPCEECMGSGIVSCCDTAGAFADVTNHGVGFVRVTSEGVRHIPFADVLAPAEPDQPAKE